MAPSIMPRFLLASFILLAIATPVVAQVADENLPSFTNGETPEEESYDPVEVPNGPDASDDETLGNFFSAPEELPELPSEEQNEPKNTPTVKQDKATSEEEAYQLQLDAYKETILEDDFTQKAQLQALNKITARAHKLDIELDKRVKFGNLEIQMHRCWKAPQTQIPESKALIEIHEQIPGEERKLVFHGWMFSSSPSLSAMEHPVYDVRVLECIHSAEKETTTSQPQSDPTSEPQSDPDSQ
jgi:hypothetical protein